jgi:hypothetical protein
MLSKDNSIKWLQKRMEEYCLSKNDMGEAVEDFDELGKLGPGFSSVDALDEVDIRDGETQRPTFINANLSVEQKGEVLELLRRYVNFFAWNYTEMPGLGRDLVEHCLPIKSGFRPYKQHVWNFNLMVVRLRKR